MTAADMRDREAGFLLADMLATLTISALVLVGLVGLGPLMLRTADRSVAAIDATDGLGRTLMSLDHLVRSASRARLDGSAARLFLFDGDERHLVLASREHEAGALPVTRAVAIRSEPDGSVSRAEAAIPVTLAAIGDLNFGPARMISAGPIRLRFAYEGAAPAGKGAAPVVPLWAVGDRMPVAVTIDAVDVATGRTVASVRSVIAADTDIGCLDGTLCGRDDVSGKASAPPPNPGATP